MPKATLDVFARLEQARNLRAEADKRAKEIEIDVLTELRNEKKTYAAKIDLIDKEIARITGKTESTGTGMGKRINGEELENAILEIVKAAGKISQLNITKHESLVKLYSGIGKSVSSQAVKLDGMVKAKKLKREGSGKSTVFHL